MKRRDTMLFVKIKPFNYQGRKFTVKPTEHVKKFSEINVLDYIRNLRTALNQTFEPMGILINKFEKATGTLSDFARTGLSRNWCKVVRAHFSGGECVISYLA